MKILLNGKRYYVDGYLHKNLKAMDKAVKKADWDNIGIIDGGEGVAKSTIAELIATILDPTYSVERCVFTPEQFQEAVLKAEKFQSIVYDEAYFGASSKGAMSSNNRNMVNLLTQIRCKNLHILVVLPSIFDLDRYVAVWRGRYLIHCYLGGGLTRGFFSFFSYEKKKQLYFTGRKFYTYSVTPDFRGRFTKQHLLDMDAYTAKKLASFSEKVEGGIGSSVKEIRAVDQRNALFVWIKQNYPEISNSKLMDYLGGLDTGVHTIGTFTQWTAKAKEKWPHLFNDFSRQG